MSALAPGGLCDRYRRVGSRIVLCSIALVVAAAAAVAAEPLARIPFEIQANRIVFPMKLGDSPEMRILLDTGLTFDGAYLFQKKWIEKLELSETVERSVAGAGADEPTSTIMQDGLTLSAGGFRFPEQRVYVSRSPRTQGFPRDGVAGWTLLGHFVVEIDHDSKTINLYEPSAFEPDPSWDVIPLTLRDKIPWLELGVTVDEGKEIPASVYIDLGAGDALLLLVRPGMKFTQPVGLERRLVGTGLSGDIYGEFGRVSSVRIGSNRLKDVSTVFTPAEVRSKQEGADGIIGSDLLRRFNVVFDYSQATLYLKPNREFKNPFE